MTDYDPRVNKQGPRSLGEAMMMSQKISSLSDEELVDLIGLLDQKDTRQREAIEMLMQRCAAAERGQEVMFKAGYDFGFDDGHFVGSPVALAYPESGLGQRNPQAAWIKYTTSKR